MTKHCNHNDHGLHGPCAALNPNAPPCGCTHEGWTPYDDGPVASIRRRWWPHPHWEFEVFDKDKQVDLVRYFTRREAQRALDAWMNKS